ncbi:MAG: adenosylcobinamide-GDP ribazoletransferase [Lachnospiraceae bacterium]|nr:adenosylcobinamide-GDP ribazoletransferase [Lachnospiraceae bacterium]
MHILKSLAAAFVVAFSIYSKIPVPQFPWKEEDMKYMLCFFPWVGAVIGGLIYLWSLFCKRFGIGELCYLLLGTAIPLLVTGGFHVDGFMDTMDAFHSYGSREKKLEILKDPHIGAFAVIMLALYELLYMGAFSEVRDARLLRIVCGGFFLSRSLSGISVVSFPKAKKEGMLYEAADRSQKGIVKGALYLQSLLCICFMLRQSLLGGAVVAAAFASFGYYGWRTRKELGGITGDTAGFFVLICEACMMTAAAVVNVFL